MLLVGFVQKIIVTSDAPNKIDSLCVVVFLHFLAVVLHTFSHDFVFSVTAVTCCNVVFPFQTISVDAGLHFELVAHGQIIIKQHESFLFLYCFKGVKSN